MKQTTLRFPQFVTLVGTLGSPESKINKLALTSILVQSTGLGEKAGKLIPGQAGAVIQNILGGGNTSNPTNKPTPPRNLLALIRSIY